jgi:heptaprenylglycerol acetyltransferase
MSGLMGRVLNRLAFVLPGGFSVRPRLQRWRGVRLGRNVWISQYVYMDEIHPEAIVIGENSSIGLRTSVITHLYWGPRRGPGHCKEVVIGPNVFVGPHCLVLPGVHIGEGAVIRGGSVVTRDVPPRTFWGPPAAGPLARVTAPLTREHGYDGFVKGLMPYPRRRGDAIRHK